MIDPSYPHVQEHVETLPIKRSRGTGSEIRRWFLTIFITAILAICLLGGSLVVAIYMAARSDQERHADAIVVMGAAQFDGRPSAVLKARLDTTYQVWKDGVAPVIIVTGGKMPGDRFTESEASRDYLVDRGVPEEAILLENEGRTSQSSLQRVGTIARDHHIHSVVIVSDGFHLFRSKLIADRNGLDAFGVPAEDSPIRPWTTTEFGYVVREAGGVLAYLML
ncbi:MAG TPA: YdcF family protein [Thermomicrobiales bacterium]|nr:YdcF family protein [Thermomicrobiales bacterium]